jgi:hypothetical protein
LIFLWGAIDLNTKLSKIINAGLWLFTWDQRALNEGKILDQETLEFILFFIL